VTSTVLLTVNDTANQFKCVISSKEDGLALLDKMAALSDEDQSDDKMHTT